MNVSTFPGTPRRINPRPAAVEIPSPPSSDGFIAGFQPRDAACGFAVSGGFARFYKPAVFQAFAHLYVIRRDFQKPNTGSNLEQTKLSYFPV